MICFYKLNILLSFCSSTFCSFFWSCSYYSLSILIYSLLLFVALLCAIFNYFISLSFSRIFLSLSSIFTFRLFIFNICSLIYCSLFFISFCNDFIVDLYWTFWSYFCFNCSSLLSNRFFICSTLPSISMAFDDDYSSILTIFSFCFMRSLINSCNFLLFFY